MGKIYFYFSYIEIDYRFNITIDLLLPGIPLWSIICKMDPSKIEMKTAAIVGKYKNSHVPGTDKAAFCLLPEPKEEKNQNLKIY